MSNDLSNQLRSLNTFEWMARPATTKQICFDAADRIEELERYQSLHAQCERVSLELEKKLVEQLKIAHSRLPQWQPVETAPRDDTDVLVLCEDGGILIGCHCGTKWWIEQTYFEERKPTHWMPIPEPPKLDK